MKKILGMALVVGACSAVSFVAGVCYAVTSVIQESDTMSVGYGIDFDRRF